MLESSQQLGGAVPQCIERINLHDESLTANSLGMA